MKSANADLFVPTRICGKSGARVRRHPKLSRYHACIDGVDVDIYTPSVCRLAITATEVFEKRCATEVQRASARAPARAEVRSGWLRWESRKGLKDRCDILSLRFEALDVEVS